MSNDVAGFNLLAFRGKMKVLHMSWMAFFVTFVVWFNHAPLMSVIKDSLGTDQGGGVDAAHAERGARHSRADPDRHAHRQVRPAACLFHPAPGGERALFRVRVGRHVRAGGRRALPARLHRGWLRGGHPHGGGVGSPPTNSVAPRASTAVGAISARPPRRCRCPRWPSCSGAMTAGATPSARQVCWPSPSASSTTSTSRTRPRVRRTSSRKTSVPSR